MKDQNVLSKCKHTSWQTHAPCIPESLLAAIRQEAAQRKRKMPVGFWFFLKQQIRFLGWKIWAGQGILLLAILFSFYGIVRQWDASLAYILPQVLFFLSLFVSGTILPILYRSYHYKMHEIEAATYYATPRILFAKLIVLAIGDLIILLSIALFTILKASVPFGSAILHLFFPFFLANYCIIQLMKHCRMRMLLSGSAGIYLLLIAGYELLRHRFPMAFSQGSAAYWSVLCVTLLALCGAQLSQITKRQNFTELQIA